ncbi:MAG: MBL fold metallo-hydrolase [Deinococcota bacterium]
MSVTIQPLFFGFPGISDRGFLGWSSCVLLQTGQRNILFDTCGYNERGELLKRLEKHQLIPADVDAIILSHFHFDHAVNYRLFPNAKLYIHELELEHARTNATKDLAIPAEMLADMFATERVTELADEEGTCEGLSWRLAPGHTPGLVVLELATDKGLTVLASDAVKSLEAITQDATLNTWNLAQTRKSITIIQDRATRILPGHDGWLIKDATTGQFRRETPPSVTVQAQHTWHLKHS